MNSHIYVDVAMNGAMNRNKIHPFSGLITWDKHLKDTYTTYFRYTEDMKKHVKETGSVKNFTGTAYSPWIPFDIDVEGNIREARAELLKLLKQLIKYGVSIESLKIYFSGSKGFHVMLPSSTVGVEPSEDIHVKFRRFAKRIGNGIKLDMSIYDKVKLFRLPNTINTKSGLYKIQLKVYDLEKNAYDIQELAKEQRQEWEVPECGINDMLQSIYESEEVSKPILHTTSSEIKTKVCMHKMMQGIGQGERDNSAIRVVDHMKKSGLNPDMVWVALRVWNDKNHPPLTEEELKTTYEQGMKEYNYGCHDPLLEKYCDKNCIFYKPEWRRFP